MGFSKENFQTLLQQLQTKQRIDRPLQLIIPLKLRDAHQSNKSIKFIDNDNSESSTRCQHGRECQNSWHILYEFE